jgi:hypothetical protein
MDGGGEAVIGSVDKRLPEWNRGSVSTRGRRGISRCSCLGRRSMGDDGQWWALRGRWRWRTVLARRHRWSAAQAVGGWYTKESGRGPLGRLNGGRGGRVVRSPVNKGGGREWRAKRAGWHGCRGGGKGKILALRAPFIAARGGGRRWRGGGNGGQETAVMPQSRCRACGLGVVVQTERLTGGPHWFNIYPDFLKPVQTCKFKIDAFHCSK